MTKVRLKDGIRVNLGNFPADLLIETSSFYCRGLRFDPWSGNRILQTSSCDQSK